MFAIIQSGGKQYRVSKGDVLSLEAIDLDPGEELELPVLMLGGEQVVIGTPIVDGASVDAEVLEHGYGDKIHVVKYKAKINYRRKYGHRQRYTKVRISEIRIDADQSADGSSDPLESDSIVQDESPSITVE
ncbi:MAG: 50S ribosomal protein L21 [Trueperaceae bacterium]|jgi:large subunit ribosomal protein L21|nr:50S ribosomal protein L21 [Trueperaceae bacterium]|tara:strand:+ start:29271 stop:29663 length:393 start_codon:yes stop_codon:yes gene_type:complete